MRQRIIQELRRIERQHDVRVLLAVESGSRAWGFASPDSDYDVRFVYAHRADWYLSVFEQHDVIEETLAGDLDVSGWELRKTLRLFAKCNLALNEWLGSDIVYDSVPAFTTRLAALIPSFFNPVTAIHHYRRTAYSAFSDNYVAGTIGIKKLFYVLRPLLACRWIEENNSQPPTQFEKLVASPWLSDVDRAWIGALLAKKAVAAEAERIALDRHRADAIAGEIERQKVVAATMNGQPRAQTADLDKVLREWTAW